MKTKNGLSLGASAPKSRIVILEMVNNFSIIKEVVRALNNQKVTTDIIEVLILKGEYFHHKGKILAFISNKLMFVFEKGKDGVLCLQDQVESTCSVNKELIEL